MDIKLFESIRQGAKQVNGNAHYEALTGRTTAAVAMAKDWLQALKDIVAEKADALKVIADFEKRIDAEVAKGDLSDIYAHIRHQMPDTNDLGMVAANIQDIEQWIKQGGNKHENANAKDGVAAQPAVNEAMGDGGSVVTATKKPSKVNSSGETPDIIKTSLNYTNSDALDAFNSNQEGTVGDEIVEGRWDDIDPDEYDPDDPDHPDNIDRQKRHDILYDHGDDGDYEADEGYYVDEDDNVFYVYESGDAFYVDEDYEPVQADDTYIGNIYTHEIFGEALEVVEEGYTIGAPHSGERGERENSRDARAYPNGIKKGDHPYYVRNTIKNNIKATRDSDAFTVQHLRNIRWPKNEDYDDNTVRAWEYFFDEDGAVVYYDDYGQLWEASAEDAEAFIDAINEDINIYYNNDGQGGGGMPPDGGDSDGGMPPDDGSGGTPPEMGGDPNAIGDPNGAPQKPMQVELINGGESGEVNGVVIDVAGKHIEIGPDGVVNEQPAGGQPAPAPADGNAPPQKPLKEGLDTQQMINRMKAFFNEDNDNYTDAARRTPQTASGGTIPKGVKYIDPEALDDMNSGGDIDGDKTIGESAPNLYEIFVDQDNDLVYYNKAGDLCYATDEDAAEWHKVYGNGGVGEGYTHHGYGNSADKNTVRNTSNLYKTDPSRKGLPSSTYTAMRNLDKDLLRDQIKRNLTKARDSDADNIKRPPGGALNPGYTPKGFGSKKKKYAEAAGDYDALTVAHGLGRSLRAPEGRPATDQFEGDLNEASMVASGNTLKPATPETPDQFYNLGNKDFNGKPVAAKDREKPDQQKSESVPEKVDIVNTGMFNALTRPSKMSEGWKAKEELLAEQGEKPNKN